MTTTLPKKRDEGWKHTDPSTLTNGLHTKKSPDEHIVAFKSHMMAEVIGMKRSIAGHISHITESETHHTWSGKNTQPLIIQGTPKNAQRWHLHVKPNTEAVLIEHVNGGTHLIQAHVEEGATLVHLRIDESEVDGGSVLLAQVAKEGHLEQVSLAHTDRARRLESFVWMNGELANAKLTCLHLGDKPVESDAGDSCETVFWIKHNAPSCESQQVMKTLLKQQGVSRFHGKIHVDQKAQKTDGYQMSQALMLEDGGTFYAKPELEIYADDVVCSHGSTTGSVNEEALAFCQARGIPRKMAQTLLAKAFVMEALENTNVNIKEMSEEILEKLLTKI